MSKKLKNDVAVQRLIITITKKIFVVADTITDTREVIEK